ncbi:hypothetical protein [Virgibacillus halodenitrificans]|uniref:hypothetical protein n=1 Tax=Virgibacillus halodenitrificans TaxID=1482 RepID=UPI000EF47E8D|nr:hypothetical protein [Virgibacillus halodenitrificans]
MDIITKISILIIIGALLFVVGKSVAWLLQRFGHVFSKKRMKELDRKRDNSIKKVEGLGIHVYKKDEYNSSNFTSL